MIFECFFIIFNHAFVWTDIETEVAEVPIFQVTEVPTNRYEYSIPFECYQICLVRFKLPGSNQHSELGVCQSEIVEIGEREREKERERERVECLTLTLSAPFDLVLVQRVEFRSNLLRRFNEDEKF